MPWRRLAEVGGDWVAFVDVAGGMDAPTIADPKFLAALLWIYFMGIPTRESNTSKLG
jgi:hypothetical protein